MRDPGRLSICVYCGSRHGERDAFSDAARRLGRAIGERGMRLVYGGGKVGLMGEVADAALAAGAPVLGVIPRALMEREVGHRGLTELRVVETMHERKQAMAEPSDAFIALPGGIGTLEELFEVWTWRQLGYHDQPIGLLNVEGYYDPLLAFMDRSVGEGFVSAPVRALLQVDTDPERLLDRIARAASAAAGPEDYRAI
jgi:uncharacterized protein (TIGR00730 family)